MGTDQSNIDLSKIWNKPFSKMMYEPSPFLELIRNAPRKKTTLKRKVKWWLVDKIKNFRGKLLTFENWIDD